MQKLRDVLITENITGEAMDKLLQSCDAVFEPELWRDRQKLLGVVPDFRGLIVRNQTQVTQELLNAAKRLEVIGRAGVGLDNVDVAAATERGVVIAFTPEQNSNSVAELAIGLMLSLARMIPAADRDTKQGGWKRQKFTGVEILGKTLGVVGFGRIGACTAVKARALGMDIVAYDPFIDAESLKAMESRARLTSLDEVLSESDFISCHLPATKDTIKLFGYDSFCRMKSRAFFINTSRGEVVDEDGLLRALAENKIAGAALDVRANEPPAPGRFVEMENVILTPHVGAFTNESQRRVVSAVCSDVRSVLSGGAAKNYVNFSRPRGKQ